MKIPTPFAVLLPMLALALACGHEKPPTAPQGSPAKDASPQARAEVHERIVPHTCAARTKLAQLFGQNAPPPAPIAAAGGDSAPPPTSVAGGTKLAANQAYRLVAPGTVLITTEHGLGTGVVIDPKGFVLTNFHIVNDGQKKDFFTTVHVTFGDLTPTGRMNKQDKSYDAVVVKADPVRDLALVKLQDPPAKMETVKLAKSAPQIAEKVMSIGHAGIGFLWAAKSCSIASIGERQRDTSILAALDCSRTDPAASATEAKMTKERCEEHKKEMTEAFNATTQGLALQTDCSITHGDSGGPLVNASGEMVGLNQSITADVATAAFHVHLDEIRDFTAKYPSAGVALLPDPFCDGGANETLEDIDLDGVPDTLVSKGGMSLFGGYDRISLLIDLDQDHFSKKKDPNAAFDTELALLKIRDESYIWYDVDGDSHFDLLLVDKDSDGTPESAYKLDAEGHAKEDKSLLPKHDLSAKLIKNAELHARLGKIGDAIGASKYLSKKLATAASTATTFPDPIAGGGTEGRVLDADGDGKPDVAVMRATFSRAILIDSDDGALGSLKVGDPADDLVKAKKVKPQVSLVMEGSNAWAMYDTNADGKLDLALMTTNGADPASLFVTNAWHLSPTGESTPAPDQLGRRLLRPSVTPSRRVENAFRLLNGDVATDEGLGSLPDPHRPNARFDAHDVKGFPANSVMFALTMSSSVMLFDVDHDTKIPPKADMQKVIADGKFDAEVAVVHRQGADWIYYDTDGDNRFDLVLYVASSGHEPVQAYRVSKSGGPLTADSAAVPGRPYRTKSVFKDKAIAAKWKALASKVFNVSAIED